MTKQETVLLTRSLGAWSPVRGDATEALGVLLVNDTKDLPDQETFDGVVTASVAILRRCKRFDSHAGTRTGLVVGYVQSGKTVSMTTVASLARDNGCRIVILLAGVTENLLNQTARKRIRPYLSNKPDARRAWRLHDTVESPDLDSLKHELTLWVREWQRADVPEERKRPLFLTVMKQHVHLARLRDFLRHVDLSSIPSLVIDDEADQASLDTTAAKASGPPSTTYQRIREIRQALPNHTYLQYTATPQAPVLISLADMLSPDFAHVLEPGRGYTGGRTFFIERPELVTEVPTDDLFDPNSPPTEPPESLVIAMRQFFIGAAAGFLRGASGKRSMLIHPSQRQNDHNAFFNFATRMKNSWLSELRSDEPQLRAAAADDFREAYDDIANTGADLPAFNNLLEEIPYVLSDTRVWKVNSEDGREVDWEQCYAHILIGGDKLNRGFTVEGLSVTYMPRKPGGWNADTIQQRARFFGYKAKYLGLCRVHLHPEVADAYREYVHHEEDIRVQLKRHEGRPLKEWKRAFLLDHRLHPTRTNVLSETVHKPKPSAWFRQNYPHVDIELARRNLERVTALDSVVTENGGFREHNEHKTHTVARLPLGTVFEKFLVDYECFANDAIEWTAVALWLGELLNQQPTAECLIVRILGGRARERSEDKDASGRINQLFEGRRAKGGADAYKGDEALRDKDLVTLQLHTLIVKRDDGSKIPDVPAIAVRLPDTFMSNDVVVQHKKGQ